LSHSYRKARLCDRPTTALPQCQGGQKDPCGRAGSFDRFNFEIELTRFDGEIEIILDHRDEAQRGRGAPVRGHSNKFGRNCLKDRKTSHLKGNSSAPKPFSRSIGGQGWRFTRIAAGRSEFS
jgi:hypothetical protein